MTASKKGQSVFTKGSMFAGCDGSCIWFPAAMGLKVPPPLTVGSRAVCGPCEQPLKRALWRLSEACLCFKGLLISPVSCQVWSCWQGCSHSYLIPRPD